MKPVKLLRIALAIIILGTLASCASTAPSSNPCAFQPYRKPAVKQKTQAPPHSVTPIGGNYKIRN